jgi:hemerythrin-like domain-containing protein
MVQGGHVLLDALVEDICAEHDLQAAAIKELQSLARILGSDPACAPVIATLEDFLTRLREHIRVEEEELIPLFRDR